MMQKVSKPVRQFAALALLAALCLAVWGLVITPLAATIQDQDRRILAQREVLGRFLDAGRLEKEARALETKLKVLDTQKLVLEGESDSLRSAVLQTALTTIAGTQGLRLKSTRPLPARESGGVRFTGVQAQFQATLEQLQRILIAIDLHQPILLIDALRVTAPPGASDPKTEAPLNIDIEVSGATGPAKG